METKKKVISFLHRAVFQVLDAALENIFLSDEEGRIVYFNPAAEKATGYKLTDLAGESIGVFYKDAGMFKDAMDKIVASKQALTYEAVILDKFNREKIFTIKKAPLFDENGDLIGFMSISSDMTDIRLHEEELRAMKEFNEAVLNSAQDMITVTDVDGMITYFNPAAELITGYKKEEILGRNISLFYKDKDLSDRKLSEIGENADPEGYEAIILDKHGSEHIFSIHKAPLYDDDGELIGFTATSRDVTEQRRQYQELRRLQLFNEAVLKSVHDLVVVTDIDGNITYYNPMAEQVTERRFEEVKGRKISEFYTDPGFSDEKMNYIRQTGEANSYEARIVTKTGEERILAVNKAPLHDAAGDLIGFAAVSRDVTRRKKAEERICELQDMLTGDAPVSLDRDLLHSKTADMFSPHIPALNSNDSFADAADRMVRYDLPGLPVTGSAGEIIGVVRMKDLLEKGLFQGVDLMTPVREVMQRDFLTIEPDAYYFDAMLAMVKSSAQMLPVAEGRHLRGVLTMNDMMRSRGVSIINVLNGIEEQDSIENLSRFRSEVDNILKSLVVDGALASQVTGIITEFNDRITRRVLSLNREKMGRPPARFAWLGLGSEGRREQTLTTDQDNAMIMEDGVLDDKNAMDYFVRFAEESVQGLARCGFKLCQGNIMASNAKWVGDSAAWTGRVRKWVELPTPRGTRDAMTFLDFRGIYGDMELARDLRSAANTIFLENSRVLTPMAEDTLSKAPPLGLFKRFMVERSGEFKGRLNLKVQGTLIIIDCLRLLAVKEGLFSTNTLDRLNGLKEKEIFSEDQASDIKEAYQTLMGLRLMNNVNALKNNEQPSNHINPDALPQWKQQRLKDAFIIADELQKHVRRIFWWLK